MNNFLLLQLWWSLTALLGDSLAARKPPLLAPEALAKVQAPELKEKRSLSLRGTQRESVEHLNDPGRPNATQTKAQLGKD